MPADCGAQRQSVLRRHGIRRNHLAMTRRLIALSVSLNEKEPSLDSLGNDVICTPCHVPRYMVLCRRRRRLQSSFWGGVVVLIQCLSH